MPKIDKPLPGTDGVAAVVTEADTTSVVDTQARCPGLIVMPLWGARGPVQTALSPRRAVTGHRQARGAILSRLFGAGLLTPPECLTAGLPPSLLGAVLPSA